MYRVEMKADLSFTLERKEDGDLEVKSGWFDARSSESGLSARIFLIEADGTETEILDDTVADRLFGKSLFIELYEATPGKGSVDVS